MVATCGRHKCCACNAANFCKKVRSPRAADRSPPAARPYACLGRAAAEGSILVADARAGLYGPEVIGIAAAIEDVMGVDRPVGILQRTAGKGDQIGVTFDEDAQ